MAKGKKTNEYKVEVVGGIVAGFVLIFITGISETFRDWLFREMDTRYSNPLWRILLFIIIGCIVGLFLEKWRTKKSRAYWIFMSN